MFILKDYSIVLLIIIEAFNCNALLIIFIERAYYK